MKIWKRGRVAYCTCLLNRRREIVRWFESSRFLRLVEKAK